MNCLSVCAGESDGEKGDSTCKDTEDDDEAETDTEAGQCCCVYGRLAIVLCIAAPSAVQLQSIEATCRVSEVL